MKNSQEIMLKAWSTKTVIPAFNIPYLAIMEPVVCALRDSNCFGFIAVARCEWTKFQSKSIQAVYEEYQKQKDERFTRLHLDHIPVIDEDNLKVDYISLITEAIKLGYDSVMIDGSRLPLTENIQATAKVVNIAHTAGIPVEAELGAVLGHESGPLPPYEELFASGKGFTSPEEAVRFIKESGVDWLSVAVGNIHGAISGVAKSAIKPEARINIKHLSEINQALSVPLVLHGGSGIKKSSILDSIKHGISKINIGTTVRQAYEQGITISAIKARENVYETVTQLINEELEITGSATILQS